MLSDCLLIIFISICTAFLGEGLTWILVYRTEKYKKLKAEVEKQCKKLEKKKMVGESSDRNVKKRLGRVVMLCARQYRYVIHSANHFAERQEERLKNHSRELSMVKMKSMFAIGVTFSALLGMFNTIFDGHVVAILPFTPISMLQGISHRNLPGDDYTHCSFIFLYILSTMSIRQNIQKLLGLTPSRAASKQGSGFFTTPSQLAK